ncbi:hypothetical protein [Stenotrophobium rhamnosiphilum]|nr:hypothetical protein [Stenotrophobium rhamnosiphilum]
MKNYLLITASAFSVMGCSLFQTNARPNDDLRGAGAPVTRAYFFKECPPGAEESAAPVIKGFDTASLIVSAIGFVVDKTADAVVAAAKDDKEALTFTGSAPEMMYADAKLRGCLAIVIAPRAQDGEWCKTDANKQYAHGWNKDLCTNTPDKFTKDLWQRQSLGAPALFAKIQFGGASFGSTPAGYAIPQLVALYYPKPLANRDASKIESLTLTVKALAPLKKNSATGDSVFEVVIAGEGLSPKPGFRNTSDGLGDQGLWIVVPKVESKTPVPKFDGPVNLTVTVTETPHASEWLQKVAAYADKHRDDAKTALDKQFNPATIAVAQSSDEDKKAAADIALAKGCGELITLLGKSITDKGIYDAANAQASKDPLDLASKKNAANLSMASCSAKYLEITRQTKDRPVCSIPDDLEAKRKGVCP